MNPEIQEWMNNENAKTRSKLNSQDAIDEGLIPYPYNFPAIEFVVDNGADDVWEDMLVQMHNYKLHDLGIWVNDTVWA